MLKETFIFSPFIFHFSLFIFHFSFFIFHLFQVVLEIARDAFMEVHHGVFLYLHQQPVGVDSDFPVRSKYHGKHSNDCHFGVVHLFHHEPFRKQRILQGHFQHAGSAMVFEVPAASHAAYRNGGLFHQAIRVGSAFVC